MRWLPALVADVFRSDRQLLIENLALRQQLAAFKATHRRARVRNSDRLFWVLGIDMAHMGRRYGDPYSAQAERGEMLSVGGRDRERIECVNRADTAGFWDRVQENHDDLKWCGSSPFYTFLKTVPGVTANLRRYEQWNIDPQSVVTFGALTFSK